jgi:hypothetical protein
MVTNTVYFFIFLFRKEKVSFIWDRLKENNF